MLVLLRILISLFSLLTAQQYKEKRAEGGERQELYHTWFVRTEFGDKLLVLTGQDPTYREWLREFSKNYELFLVKMPDSESAAFEQDRVVRTQVQNLHPVDKELLQKTKGKKRQKRN